MREPLDCWHDVLCALLEDRYGPRKDYPLRLQLHLEAFDTVAQQALQQAQHVMQAPFSIE